MSKAEKLIRWLDRQHSQTRFFVATIVLLGTLLIGASYVSWMSGRQQEQLSDTYDRTLAVIDAANQVEHASLEMIRGERGYLLTGKAVYLGPYEAGRAEMASALDKLEILSENVSDRRLDDDLRAKAQTYESVLARIVAHQQEGRHEQAMSMIGADEGRAALQEIEQTLDMTVRKQRLALKDLRSKVARANRNQQRFYMVVSLAGICLLLLASLSVVALRRAAERERIYRTKLRRQAQTDELTGLANRRELMASLERAISATRRSGEPLSLAILDIDHFKRVNDNFGHPAGDEVIRQVALAALAAVRGGDIVGRMGGEEFAIVLPGASIEQAYTICERLRAQIHARGIALPDGDEVRVTISSGISLLLQDETGSTLIERADHALYDAKNGGRDQVRLAA